MLWADIIYYLLGHIQTPVPKPNGPDSGLLYILCLAGTNLKSPQVRLTPTPKHVPLPQGGSHLLQLVLDTAQTHQHWHSRASEVCDRRGVVLTEVLSCSLNVSFHVYGKVSVQLIWQFCPVLQGL